MSHRPEAHNEIPVLGTIAILVALVAFAVAALNGCVFYQASIEISGSTHVEISGDASPDTGATVSNVVDESATSSPPGIETPEPPLQGSR